MALNEELCVLDANLSIDDTNKLLDAVKLWANEFNMEHEAISGFLSLNFNELPTEHIESIPEEMADKFKDFFEAMQKSCRKKKVILESKIPERQDEATLLRASLLLLRKRLTSKLAEQLGDPDFTPPPSSVKSNKAKLSPKPCLDEDD